MSKPTDGFVWMVELLMGKKWGWSYVADSERGAKQDAERINNLTQKEARARKYKRVEEKDEPTA